MIKGIFIVNNNGKARLVKCYERMNEEQQAAPRTWSCRASFRSR